MKAVHLTGYGRTSDQLEVREVADPGAPGPGEALVAVDYAPVNFNDLMVLWGTFPWRPETPAIIGNEGGGIVLSVGHDVTVVKPGDRVVLPLVSGTWRERLIVPAEALAVVPTSADPKQSALLGINATTAAILLGDFVDLQPGDAVVYNAANSGLARWLTLLAHQKGLTTIGLIRREADTSAVQLAGCDIVIADSEPVAEAQKRLDGLNVRLGLDVVGGASAGRVLEMISAGGTLVNYGSVTERPMELSAAALTFKQITVKGFFLGFPDQAAKAHRLLPRLGEILAAERVEQPIAAIYPIDKIREAADHAAAGGRVLIEMTPY